MLLFNYTGSSKTPSEKKADEKKSSGDKTTSVTMEINDEYDPANPTEGEVPVKPGDKVG